MKNRIFKLLIILILVIIKIQNSQAQLCAPTYSNGCSLMGIDEVAIDTGGKVDIILSLSTGCGVSKLSPILPLIMGKNYTLKFKLYGNYYQGVTLFINKNGDNFLDSSEAFLPSYSYYLGSSTNYYEIPFVIPSTFKEGNQYGFRLVSKYNTDYNYFIKDGCGSFDYGEYEDYFFKVSSKVQSIDTAQIFFKGSGLVSKLDTKIPLVGVNIPANYTQNPFSITKIQAKIDGKTTLLSNYKLYYSNNSNQFSNSTLVSSTNSVIPGFLNNPTVINFTLNAPIQGGNNYFWVASDLGTGANSGDSIKVGISNITLNRGSDTLIKPQYASTNYSQLLVDYNKAKFDNYVSSNILSYLDINSFYQYFYSQNGDSGYYAIDPYYSTIELSSGANYATTFGVNSFYGAKALYAAMFVDYNKDGKYTGYGEFIDLGAIDSVRNLSEFAVPYGVANGTYRFRFMVAARPLLNTDFANHFVLMGEARDYNLNIVSKFNSTNTSISISQNDKLYPIPAEKKMKVLLATMQQDYNSSTSDTLTKVVANIYRSNINNISNIKLWYAPNVNNFNYATQIGTAQVPNKDSVVFNLNKSISSGDLYFWLTYDLSATAAIGDTLSAYISRFEFKNYKTIIPEEVKNGKLPNYYGYALVSGSVNMKNDTVITCNSNFYDDGGKFGNASNKSYIQTFSSSDINHTLKASFTSFKFDQNSNDTLYIYDGVISDSTKLSTVYYSQFWFPFTVNSTSQYLIFVYKPGSKSIAQGWEGVISCEYNCDKNPFDFSYSIDSAQCNNQSNLFHFKIKNGVDKPYKLYMYTGGEKMESSLLNSSFNSEIYFNTDTFSVYVPSNQSNFTLSNASGCSQYISNPNFYNSASPSIYKNLSYPSCYIGHDGVVKLISSSTGKMNYEWSVNGIIGKDSIVPNLKYSDVVFAKITDSLGNCSVDSIYFNAYDSNIYPVKDSVYNKLPAPQNASLSLSNFTVYDTTQSLALIVPFFQVSSANISNVKPDSVSWNVKPYWAVSSTPKDTSGMVIWKDNFSGKVTMQARIFKSGCRGPLAPSVSAVIKPDFSIASNYIVSLDKITDSAKVRVKFYGSLPYDLHYLNPKGDTIKVKKILSSDYELPVFGQGHFQFLSVTDSFGVRSDLRTVIDTISVTYDSVTAISATIDTLCNRRVRANVSVTNGKAPYRLVLKYIQNSQKITDTLADGVLNPILKANQAYSILVLDKNLYQDNISPLIVSVTDTSSSKLLAPKVLSKSSIVATFGSDTVLLHLDSIQGGIKYKWYVSDTSAIVSLDSGLVSKLVLKPNYSGVLNLKAVAYTTNCESDSTTLVSITRNPNLNFTISDTSIFYKDSTSLTLNYQGSLPAKVFYELGLDTLVLDLKNTTNQVVIKNAGKYKILGVQDVHKLYSKFNNLSFQVTLDTVSIVNVTEVNSECGAKKIGIDVQVKGGQAPYIFKFYDLKNNLIHTSNSVNKDSLPAGFYKLQIVESNGFVSNLKTIFEVKGKLNVLKNILPTISGMDTTILATGVTINGLIANADTLKGVNYHWMISDKKALTSFDTIGNQLILGFKVNYTGDVNVYVRGSLGSCFSDSSAARKFRIKPVAKIVKATSDFLTVNLYGTSPFKLAYQFPDGSVDSVTLDKVGLQTIPLSQSINNGEEIKVTLLSDANTFNPDTITSVVTVVNKPTTQPDIAITRYQTPVLIDIFANDVDTLGLKPTSVDLSTASGLQTFAYITGKGSFTMDSNGKLLFFPADNVAGWVDITYRVANLANVYSDFTTVRIWVGPNVNKDEVTLDAQKQTQKLPIFGNDKIGTKNNLLIDLEPLVVGYQSSKSFVFGTVKVQGDSILVIEPNSAESNFDSIGVFGFYYSVTDSAGLLSDTAIVKVTLNSDLYFYDAFSPNGDNKNESYYIKYINPKTTVSLRVFDLQGFLVYQSDDYKNNWEGTNSEKGGDVLDGVYVAVINVYPKDKNEDTKPLNEYRRFVTIKREIK